MVKIQKISGSSWKATSSLFNEDASRNMFGYGTELILNLYECDLIKISTKKHLQQFIKILCDDVIHMKRYGKALIPNFGHENPLTSGYSLVQFIETSSVTGHFSDTARSGYLNIFSCAYFDPQKTTKFCLDFFGAKKADVFLIMRP